jgi:hypothetical protein
MKPRKIICSVCQAGPCAEDGGRALYAVMDEGAVIARYCGACLPPDLREKVLRERNPDADTVRLMEQGARDSSLRKKSATP